MDIADWIFILVVSLYWHWMPAVLVLLNWILARWLEKHFSLGRIVAINAAVSLLLLAPLRQQGSGFVFPGVIYYPWYLDYSAKAMDNLPWMALLMLMAGAAMMTVAAFYHRKRKVARVRTNEAQSAELICRLREANSMTTV